MATFKTGRHRTASWSGTTQGALYYVLRRLGAQLIVFAQTDSVFALDFGPSFPFLPSLFAVGNQDSPSGSFTWEPSWQCSVSTGLGASDTDVNQQSITVHVSGAGEVDEEWSQSVDGTWSISMDVEEFVSIDGGDYPSYGGSINNDPPLETTVTFFEALKVGGHVSVSLECGGASASATSTVGVGEDYVIPYMLFFSTVSTTCGALFNQTNPGSPPFNVPAGAENRALITSAFQGAAMTGVYYRSATGAYADASNGCAAHTDVPGTGGRNEAQCYANLAPPKRFHLAGIVNAMNEPYPEGVTLVVGGTGAASALLAASGGTFEQDYQQRNFNCDSILNTGNQTSVNTDESSAVQVHVQVAWLVGASENNKDWRSCIRGWPYESFDIEQAASQTVDPGDDLTPSDMAGSWSGSGLDTLDVSGDQIRAVVGAGTGSATRTFTDFSSSWRGASFGGYRYLDIVIAADDDSQPFTLEITTPIGDDPEAGAVSSRTWETDAAGAALTADIAPKTVTIDLCGPTSYMLDTDSKDTVWPFQGDPHFVEDTELWGVTNALTLALTGLATGKTYLFGPITLARKHHSRLDLLPAFDSWINSDAEAIGSADYRDRFLLGDTDGRLSLFRTDFYRDIDANLTILSITDGIVDSVNGAGGAYPSDGWEATAATFSSSGCGDPVPPLVCVLTNDNPAVFAGGGGAWYDGEWHVGIGQDAASGLTVMAQFLVDTVDFPPESGDAFQYEGLVNDYSGPMELRAAKILRGGAQGLVFDTTPEAKNDVTVLLTEGAAGGTARGSGVSDARGQYLTGAPFGKGNKSHTIEAQSGSKPAAGATLRARKWQRACFVVSDETGQGISYDVSDAMRHVRAYRKDGSLWVGIATNIAATAWADRDTGINGSNPWIRWDKISNGQHLILYYDDGSSVYRATSANDGSSWAMATTVAAGEHGAGFPTRHHTEHIFWVDGSAIKGVILDGVGNVVKPAFTAVASGVDDDAIAAWEHVRQGGVWHAKLLYRSSGNIVIVDSTDGVTFT